MKIWTRNQQMRFPQGEVKKMYKEQTALYNPSDLASFLRIPVYLMGGTNDQLLSPAGFKQLFSQINTPDKIFDMVEDAGHNFTKKTHQERLYSSLLTFFKKTLKNRVLVRN
jgi:esterase/lipase